MKFIMSGMDVASYWGCSRPETRAMRFGRNSLDMEPIMKIGHAMVAIASIVTFGAGCGERQSANVEGQDLKKSADVANAKIQRAAETAEKKLEGVASAVEKQAETTGKVLEDAAVTAKVKSALIAEPNLKARSIDVDTTGGVVTLKGTTENAEQKQRAEQVAASVEGVRSVRNELVVVRG
jgi:hyperosmotically inducible periplasmic protein